MKKKCIIPGCKHISKSAPGLSAHMRKEHVDIWKGSIKNTQAFLKGEEVAGPPKKKKKRRYQRRAVGARKLARRLQRAANDDQVNFCPKCRCNIEAVRVAMSFAAGNG